MSSLPKKLKLGRAKRRELCLGRETLKAYNQRFHAITRAAERYDLRLTHVRIRQIINQLKRNEGYLLQKQGNITHWRIVIDDVLCYLIYDLTQDEIATFLPKHAEFKYPDATPHPEPDLVPWIPRDVWPETKTYREHVIVWSYLIKSLMTAKLYYQIEFQLSDITQISHMCFKQQAIEVGTLYPGLTQYEVFYKGRLFEVLYGSSTRSIEYFCPIDDRAVSATACEAEVQHLTQEAKNNGLLNWDENPSPAPFFLVRMETRDSKGYRQPNEECALVTATYGPTPLYSRDSGSTSQQLAATYHSPTLQQRLPEQVGLPSLLFPTKLSP